MVEKRDRIVVLASGGHDSNVLLAEMAKKYRVVFPVYIRCGLVWEKAEIYWLRRFLKMVRLAHHVPILQPLVILDSPVTDLQKNWSTTGKKIPGYSSRDEEVYLPGRNLLLLSKAATFCALNKIHTIAIGSLSGNPFSDASPKFFQEFGKAASTALDFPIRIVAPFLRLKKKEVLQKGRGLPLHLSFSCLAPQGIKRCGRCNKCAERDKVVQKTSV